MKVKEGTNKAIVVNSTVLYSRLIITSVCSFFTTRFALQALGVVDYGLFSILGGIIALIDVANVVMIEATTRFMTVAIGKGDVKEINQQFNINLRIHVFTALFSLIVAGTIGVWYIINYLNYDGEITNALYVFAFSVVAADISMLGVPYKGLINAKENFIITTSPEVLSSLLKLVVSFILVHCFTHKLLIYAGAQSIFTIYPIVIYYFYCKKHYSTIVKRNKVEDHSKYKAVLRYSSWTLYGSVTTLAKSQGASIIINLFFNTVMNAALGIANMLNHLFNSIAKSLSKPMFPQIIKSYASGDMERCKQLLCMTTKFSYLIILLVSSPFLINADWIIGLWLVDVPPMTSKITVLIIVDLLLSSFNSGVGTVIKANGRIGMYEFAGNTLRLIAVIVAYFILRHGAPAETLFYIYIICSFVVIVINQIILGRVTHIDNSLLIVNSYLPSLVVTALFTPFVFIKSSVHPLVLIILGFVYLMVLVYFIGLNKKERQYVKSMLNKVASKKHQ